jgi:D-alanine--poly(phosphoribitol) ligase subunit 1
MQYNPAAAFFGSSVARPDDLALADAIERLTYKDAAQHAFAIANALAPVARRGSRVAILGSRSVAACLAVLGTNWTGATYVPLGLKLPEERLAAVLQSGGFDALICDREGERLLSKRIVAVAPTRILLADRAGTTQGFLRVCEGLAPSHPPAEMEPGDLAYIEFTSGTTGVPKGVEISAGALQRYIASMQGWFPLTREDRVAETSDLSFDISVNNMFSAWNAGAALFILGAGAAMSTVKFIRENEITYWYSVPSVVALLQRVKTLKPGVLPSLRHSFFAGEPLPAAAAEAWLEAAPNSTLDNLYGPTEATVVCLRQEVTRPPRVTPERGIVALGRPYPEMRIAIVDAEHKFLAPGAHGEIALSGPQLANGYLHQSELTAARFPILDGERWYLTGDLGYLDAEGVAHMLGRLDNQVKVLGNRVELEEVEVHLRCSGETSSAAAVAWPVQHGSASGIVGFVAKNGVPATRIAENMRRSLPSYMVPNSIVEMDSLPLNANGKIDRRALLSLLERGAA